MWASHVTHVDCQSALSFLRAPVALCTAAPSGDRLQSPPVDHLGDVLRRVGSQSPIGKPLSQLSDAELALGGQRSRLDAVGVRVISVVVIPGSQNRHGTGGQRLRTSSTADKNIRIRNTLGICPINSQAVPALYTCCRQGFPT